MGGSGITLKLKKKCLEEHRECLVIIILVCMLFIIIEKSEEENRHRPAGKDFVTSNKYSNEKSFLQVTLRVNYVQTHIQINEEEI